MRYLKSLAIVLLIVASIAGCDGSISSSSPARTAVELTGLESCEVFVEEFKQYIEAVRSKDSDHYWTRPQGKQLSKESLEYVRARVLSIRKIESVSVNCRPSIGHAELRFVIEDEDNRFSRLYAIVEDGQVTLLSKEHRETASSFDQGSNYQSY